MTDFQVQFLLEHAVDSRTKLHILLVFQETPQLSATPSTVAARCCRDIWSIKESLQELAEDGILVVEQNIGGDPTYRLFPRVEYLSPIQSLMQSYDDPVQRECLFNSIRELDGYAEIRHSVEKSHALSMWW